MIRLMFMLIFLAARASPQAVLTHVVDNPDPSGSQRYYGEYSCFSASGRWSALPFYTYDAIDSDQGRLDIYREAELFQVIDNGWSGATAGDNFGQSGAEGCAFIENDSSSTIELYIGSDGRGVFLYIFTDGSSTEFTFSAHLSPEAAPQGHTRWLRRGYLQCSVAKIHRTPHWHKQSNLVAPIQTTLN